MVTNLKWTSHNWNIESLIKCLNLTNESILNIHDRKIYIKFGLNYSINKIFYILYQLHFKEATINVNIIEIQLKLNKTQGWIT